MPLAAGRPRRLCWCLFVSVPQLRGVWQHSLCRWGQPSRGPHVAGGLGSFLSVCCRAGGLLAAGRALQEDEVCLETPMIAVGRHPEPEKPRSEQEREEASGARSHCHRVLQRALNDCGARGTQALGHLGLARGHTWRFVPLCVSASGQGLQVDPSLRNAGPAAGKEVPVPGLCWSARPSCPLGFRQLSRGLSSVWGGLPAVCQLVLTRDPSWLGWVHVCRTRTGPALSVFRGLEPSTHTSSAKGEVSSPGH